MGMHHRTVIITRTLASAALSATDPFMQHLSAGEVETAIFVVPSAIVLTMTHLNAANSKTSDVQPPKQDVALEEGVGSGRIEGMALEAPRNNSNV